MAKKKVPLPPVPVDCQGCKVTFSSRNAVFRHLRETSGACLSPEDYQNFLQYVQSRELRKTILLYGYLPSKECMVLDNKEAPSKDESVVRSGNDAARLLLAAVGSSDDKVNRSFGCNIRGNDIVAQDDGTGAVTEVLCTRLPELGVATQSWMNQVQEKLDSTIPAQGGSVRLLGRLDMPHNKFNAEMDVSHVRVDYLLPADFLFQQENSTMSRQEFFQSLPSFGAGHNPRFDEDVKPQGESLQYLYQLKKWMQLLTTQIVKLDPSDPAAVLEKEFHNQKRKRNRQKQQDKQDKKKKPPREPSVDSEKKGLPKNEKLKRKDTCKGHSIHVLRRRRFHNFTPRVMAHEFLAYRRLDRFYHRATLRFSGDNSRPFVALSLTGDRFLQGQACRVIGLWLALARNLVDADIVECIFDETYPHLIPTPPAPTFALIAREASYVTWEGKSKMILCPRPCDRYPAGWNTSETLRAVAEWEGVVQEAIAEAWEEDSVDEDGRLVTERKWTQGVLEPWAKRATKELEDYRKWKAAQQQESETIPEAILPPIESVDSTVPAVFEKVLYYLREADASGLWPSTTPKRQLVMVSTLAGEDAGNVAPSLSMAHMKAKSNKATRSSAYEFTEGEGGASGSFSVGAMPGDQCGQPKGNILFPQLMKYAFELEIALCPHREPSSTIAVRVLLSTSKMHEPVLTNSLLSLIDQPQCAVSTAYRCWCRSRCVFNFLGLFL